MPSTSETLRKPILPTRFDRVARPRSRTRSSTLPHFGGTIIDQTTATLIAAAVAAGASLLTLLGTQFGAKRAEMRAAHRHALQGQLEALGEGVHKTAASAVILRRRFTAGQDPTAWRDVGKTGADALKAVRPKLKYTLYGLDEPIRTLSRMPEWVATYKDVPNTNAEELLRAMQKLASAVDDTVRASYRRGLPPGAIRRWWLRHLTSNVRGLWGKRFDTADPIEGYNQSRQQSTGGS